MIYNNFDSVRLSEDGKSVVIIDQTLLPNRTEFLTLNRAEDIFEAIKKLRVRGAPAIGICAGYAMYVLAQQIDSADFMGELRKIGDYLNSSRPTAVNLSAAVKRMLRCAENNTVNTIDALREEEVKIHEEDLENVWYTKLIEEKEKFKVATDEDIFYIEDKFGGHLTKYQISDTIISEISNIEKVPYLPSEFYEDKMKVR
mgnify:CR=1 FL=1